MHNLNAAVFQHGYLLIFLIVLGEAVGLPVPAALALVAAGAAAAAHMLSAGTVFLDALIATILGDLLLFFAGRYTGWALLSFLCGVSLNPETCILRSAESFYKRGKITLLFAKFIPGVNTIAPPLAGSMKMRLVQFLWLDLAGAAVYILAYGGLGYLFRDFVGRLTYGLQSASHTVATVLLAALVVYAAYRIIQYRRYRLSGIVPRIAVEELVQRLSTASRDEVIIADVRSHGYYNADAARIAGSIRLEPNRLEQELKSLPPDKDIYLYCT
ncbi:MAG TPA: VTT domain-containing protein [Terriglobales bacterium]|nr:VTT domain-containing protein [Terriglobales bacterium]